LFVENKSANRPAQKMMLLTPQPSNLSTASLQAAVERLLNVLSEFETACAAAQGQL